MKKQDDFDNIYEILTWEALKQTGGNPFIAHELVMERNLQRERENERQL